MPAARILALVALTAILATTPAAIAAPPGLSPVGPGLWRGGPTGSPGWTAPGVGASFYDAQTIRVDWDSWTAAGGYRWSLGFDTCANPGSRLESIEWDYFRASSSISPYYAFTVFHSGADQGLTANLRDLPQGHVAVPAAGCGAELRLKQALAAANNRDQTNLHTYLVGSPAMIIRDIQAPSLSWRAGAGGPNGPAGDNGWIRAGSTAVLAAWSAGDNFGSEGIGEQRISLNGQTAWAGTPGVGDGHAVWIAVAALADGHHSLGLGADTPGLAAVSGGQVIFALDRAAPTASVTATQTGPGTFKVTTTATDATSGVATRRLAWVPAAGAPVDLTDSNQPDWTARLASLDLTAMNGTTGRLRLTVRDVAGNETITHTPLLTPDSQPPSVAVASVPTGAARWKGESALQVSVLDNRGADGIGRLQAFVFPDATASGQPVVAGTYPVTHGTNEVRLVVPAGTTDGRHRVRLVVCDPAIPGLCTTNDTATITVGAPPNTGDSPAARPGANSENETEGKGPGAPAPGAEANAPIRTTLRIVGARTRTTTTGTLVTAKAGLRVRAITGRLTALAGPVELRDPSGRLAATAVPDPDRRWRLTNVTLTRPGIWTLTINRRRIAQITVILAPTITSRHTLRGGTLRVDGRLRPGVSGKQVALEWRSQTDGRWRPVAFARTDRAGRFGLVYRFRNPAIARAVRMRVAATAERGVPLTAATGPLFTPSQR